jgi:hypothetical protein
VLKLVFAHSFFKTRGLAVVMKWCKGDVVTEKREGEHNGWSDAMMISWQRIRERENEILFPSFRRCTH